MTARSICKVVFRRSSQTTPDLCGTRRSGWPDSATDSTCPQSLFTRTWRVRAYTQSASGHLIWVQF